MKKLFLIFILLCASKLFAQAPQGINYQAVAMGTAGVLANHAISLRLSVIDSSVTGNAVYTETQNTTTDAVGLFSIVIGNGTPTVGTFSGINWGKNFKFLKTEIDTTGGTSYVLMGITQFMSTPYALYANKTKQNYADITHPDGWNNLTAIVLGIGTYTVPTGKNLYCQLNNYSTIVFGTDTMQSGSFSAGQTINNIGDTIVGFLVDKTVDWVTLDLLTNPITPPIGKSFVIISSYPNSNSFYNSSTQDYSLPKIFLNGQLLGSYLNYQTNFSQNGYYFSSGFTIPSGQTLSAQLNLYPGQYIINGYFKDN